MDIIIIKDNNLINILMLILIEIFLMIHKVTID